MESKIIRTALIQIKVVSDCVDNLKHAQKLIGDAKNLGAHLILLPECFNFIYDVNHFKEYAEIIPNGPTSEMLSKAAKEHSIYLVGGTFSEEEDKKLYNTCTVWNPQGELIAKYRKIHMFDMDIPDVQCKESDVIHSGNELVIFTIEDLDVKIGLGISYDLRFDELAKLYRLKNCDMLIYAGGFDMISGDLYWEVLQRCRATDNQLFICAVCSARRELGFDNWGCSQITDPLGRVIAQANAEEQILYADIDFNDCEIARSQLPIFLSRRNDIYDTIQIN